ncbi:MAG: adenylyl-sulfate kinase [Bacteroidota bacterium]
MIVNTRGEIIITEQNDLVRQSFTISRQQKEKLNGLKSFVLWFTGLSGAGKTTIACKLEEKLHEKKIRTIILDGDNTRLGINKDLDFSPEGRKENIRRVAEISKLMNDAGVIVIASFISPFAADRRMARNIIGKENFVEVFVDASLEICMERDTKGLYQKALAGEIKNFTGIDSPYEAPLFPSIHIKTEEQSLHDSVRHVLQWFGNRYPI